MGFVGQRSAVVEPKVFTATFEYTVPLITESSTVDQLRLSCLVPFYCRSDFIAILIDRRYVSFGPRPFCAILKNLDMSTNVFKLQN